ncbi:hypothetical protein H5410_017086, partial [Solanum commersonii]
MSLSKLGLCCGVRSIKEAGEKENLWVQKNILRLSREFGVAFKGCIEEATTLFLKIDQRREKEAPTTELPTKNHDKQMVSKELKNLFFDIKFKDAETRSDSRTRGRKQSI